VTLAIVACSAGFDGGKKEEDEGFDAYEI